MVSTKHPIIAVSTLLIDNGKVLVIERGKEPSKGLWSLPGGKQEFGERLKEAVIREVKEETDLTIINPKLLTLHEAIKTDNKGNTVSHYLLAIFTTNEFSGIALAGDDAANCIWADIAALNKLPMTKGTKELIFQLSDERLT